MGIKISAPGLENAMAGSELYRAENDEEIETFKGQIADDLVDIMDKYVDKTTNGVCVQASTIGSLEALLEFLKTMKIPVTSINIGPVHKKDILKAMKSLQGEKVQKEFATILAFDVRIMPDAQQFADDNEITIFTANIIYHLFDQFTEYVKKCRDERKSDEGSKAVFPCLLEMVKGAIFHVKDPLVIGVTVKAGMLKIGTPLCIPDKGVSTFICIITFMHRTNASVESSLLSLTGSLFRLPSLLTEESLSRSPETLPSPMEDISTTPIRLHL